MRSVVVGVDGAAAAERALRWAARTVGPEGTVHAVTAATPLPNITVTGATSGDPRLPERLRHHLNTSWTNAIRDSVGRLTTHVDASPAWEAIRSVAQTSSPDAIVVGTHVPLPVLPRTLGKTLRELLCDLPCPLVVVPDRNCADLDDGDPIVVGVGHGAATECAVQWAAELADERNLPLGLVRATHEGPVFQVEGLIDIATFYIDPAQRLTWARDDVEEMARRAQEATPHDIEIGVSTIRGLPATQLVDLSGRASLLVIGQHRTPVAGDRHVSQPLRHALTHARCPVVVVPVEPGDTERTTSNDAPER